MNAVAYSEPRPPMFSQRNPSYGKYGYRSRWCVIDGHRVGMAEQQHTILMALWNARGCNIRREIFADILWGHRADGGPENYARAILVQIANLRKVLAPTRFRVIGRQGRGHWLVRLSA